MRETTTVGAHRRLILWAVVILGAVGAEAQPDPPIMLNTFQAGQPIRARTVNDNFERLRSEIERLHLQVEALETAATAPRDCPAGYTLVQGGDVTVCLKGRDEVVKVGDGWVDRFEASLWANADCVAPRYGAAEAPDLPAEFPANGQWTQPVYACSIAAEMPSVQVTWFQAQQACLLSGKHLCTNGEWQGAAAGTPDPGVAEESPCHLQSDALRATGQNASCVSRWGVADMVGNVYEWVDWWGIGGAPTGMTPAIELNNLRGNWPAGFGGDETLGIDGHVVSSSAPARMVRRLPAAALRGGSHPMDVDAGVFHINALGAPHEPSPQVGFRCCMH